ncbi:MAG: FAD-binding protein [Raoultibacter sp.]
MGTQNILDRCNFIKGALATGAVAAAGAALSGCSPQQESKGAVAAEGSAGVATIPAGYQCSEDWLGTAPVIDADEIKETVSVDVVICGGGHAGVQAALGAAQGGATVAVLETQPEDSYAFFGDDICSYNSEFLTARGFGGYDVGEICAEYVRRGAGRVSPELIRVFVEESGDMLDNMVSVVPTTSNVFDFDSGQCQVQIAYDMPDASHYPLERGGFKAWATTIQTIGTQNEQPVVGREGVSRLTEVELYCMDAAQKLGATWHFGTAATVLVQDDSGNVTGVIAKGRMATCSTMRRKLCACAPATSRATPTWCTTCLMTLTKLR